MGFVDCSRKKQYEQCLEEKGLLNFCLGRTSLDVGLYIYILQVVPWLDIGYLPSTAISGMMLKLWITWSYHEYKTFIHFDGSIMYRPSSYCQPRAPVPYTGMTWSRVYLLHSWHYSTYHTIPSATKNVKKKTLSPRNKLNKTGFTTSSLKFTSTKLNNL